MMVNLRLSLSISRPTELVISDRSSTINTNSFFSTEPSYHIGPALDGRAGVLLFDRFKIWNGCPGRDIGT